MLLRQDDFSCIRNFAIECFNEWSDQAPLSFLFECNINRITILRPIYNIVYINGMMKS